MASKLALNGGKPVRTRPWPSWPMWDDHERKALNQVLESGKWWYGERVKQFEDSFAKFQKARYCVTSSSGTTALETCLLALNIGPGDEVIVPAYTFMASASCVMRVGATVIFADVDPGTYCVTADSIAAVITPRTKAIMPVHFAGLMADMDAIMKLAKKHKLKVIEDACHAWGTMWRSGNVNVALDSRFRPGFAKGYAEASGNDRTGDRLCHSRLDRESRIFLKLRPKPSNIRGAGTVGDCGCFSFQASKNITAGEGGAIVTNDAGIANVCRSYTNCGRNAKTPWYQHFLMGSNLRLTEFHAAILQAQLSRLPGHMKKRAANAQFLNEALENIPGLHPVPDDKLSQPRSYHLYNMRFEPKEFGCSRAALIKASKAEGLELSPGYPVPLYKQPMFQKRTGKPDYKKVFLPGCEKLCDESALWFRHSLLLGARSDMDDIVAIFRKIHARAAELSELSFPCPP